MILILWFDALNLHFSIAYIGPSVTPFTNLNPGYRIYEVDGDYANSTQVSCRPNSFIDRIFSIVKCLSYQEIFDDDKKWTHRNLL